MADYLLSGYPLSSGYRQLLEKKALSTLEPVELSKLRQLGLVGMAARLLRMRGKRLFVAYEDPNSVAILPVLHIAGALIRVRDRFVADESVRISRAGFGHALGSVASLLSATARGLFYCALSTIYAKRLASVPRQPLCVNG
jgi:hypothetical protein